MMERECTWSPMSKSSGFGYKSQQLVLIFDKLESSKAQGGKSHNLPHIDATRWIIKQRGSLGSSGGAAAAKVFSQASLSSISHEKLSMTICCFQRG